MCKPIAFEFVELPAICNKDDHPLFDAVAVPRSCIYAFCYKNIALHCIVIVFPFQC